MDNQLSEREQIADMVERYGLRVHAGAPPPAAGRPVNRVPISEDVRNAVRSHTQALAGMIRAGVEAEAGWPPIVR